MKKSTLRSSFFLAALFALAFSSTSCNKGYGCPTNFKAVKAATAAVQLVK